MAASIRRGLVVGESRCLPVLPRRIAGLFAAVCALLLLAGCRFPAPPALDPAAVSWAIYENTQLGYAFSYPDVYTPSASSDGSYVIFRYGRFSPLIIRWVGADEGRQRGLWFSALPDQEIVMGGVSGKRFVYTHWDGPFGARMISYVIPYRGKSLGVELRSDHDLDETQRAILRSLTFAPVRQG